MLHHPKVIKTEVVRWFPPLCAIFDWIVAVFILRFFKIDREDFGNILIFPSQKLYKTFTFIQKICQQADFFLLKIGEDHKKLAVNTPELCALYTKRLRFVRGTFAIK